MDPKTIAENIPEDQRGAVWHALGELLHKKKPVDGGVQANSSTGDDSGNTSPPPPPPGH